MFIKFALEKCDFKSLIFNYFNQTLYACMIYLNLIRYNIIEFTSLSLSRCRHHLIIRV